MDIKSVLIDLLKIPSVSSDIGALNEVISYVENIFTSLPGVYIEKFVFNNKPSLIISNIQDRRVDIVLNGHLDVVPISEENQFQPYEKDGRIYARGAGDMKAGDAIMIKLIYDLLKENFDKKKVSLILTTDEEVGGFDGVAKLVEMGYGGDVVLIPDGGSVSEIVFAEKGKIELNVMFQGRAAHSSRPWLGENAIDNMINFYQILKKILEEEKILYMTENRWSTTVSLNMVEGGIGGNIISDKVEATFDIRFTEKYNISELINLINIFLDKFNGKIIKVVNAPVLHTDPSNPLLQKYYQVAKKVIGENVNLVKEHGASDGRFFAEKGSVVILHRPTCGNVHGKREWVKVDDLETIYQVYKDFIID